MMLGQWRQPGKSGRMTSGLGWRRVRLVAAAAVAVQLLRTRVKRYSSRQQTTTHKRRWLRCAICCAGTGAVECGEGCWMALGNGVWRQSWTLFMLLQLERLFAEGRLVLNQQLRGSMG
jgi:hypothetical protein